MDFGNLLRAGGVLRVLFALGGRYRAALWVSLAVAVGWLLVGCAAPAGAAALGPDTIDNAGPIGIWNIAGTAVRGAVSGTIVFVALCGVGVGIVWTLVVIAGIRDGYLRNRRAPVRDDTGHGFPSSRPSWLRPAGGPVFRASRDRVGS